MPSYLGFFVDSLASYTKVLFLVMHAANKQESLECDYELSANNIRHINLGPKTPAWHRDLFHSLVLKNKLDSLDYCDVIILRSPSPLAPYFHKYIKDRTKICFMIVGDYLDGAEHLKSSTFRDKMIYQYLRYNDRNFTRQIKSTPILVNSIGLYEKYKHIAKSINLIKTTTLTSADFFKKEDTCQDEIIDLLYTGRIDVAKGLLELLEATNSLIQENYNLRLNIVGWEQDDVNRPLENRIKAMAKKYKIGDKVIFHGRKKVGKDLNKMYRQSDIYVIPSYHEGFPRTIWEAMANSLPVIATKVGGIPSYLSHNVNAILIEPKCIEDIVIAIKGIINNNQLRKTIISNGFDLAKENTLEVQTKNMISILKENGFKKS